MALVRSANSARLSMVTVKSFLVTISKAAFTVSWEMPKSSATCTMREYSSVVVPRAFAVSRMFLL